jgi:hypothetical protein
MLRCSERASGHETSGKVDGRRIKLRKATMLKSNPLRTVKTEQQNPVTNNPMIRFTSGPPSYDGKNPHLATPGDKQEKEYSDGSSRI